MHSTYVYMYALLRSHSLCLSLGVQGQQPSRLSCLLPWSVPYVFAHYYYYFYLYFTARCCSCCCRHVKYFLFVCRCRRLSTLNPQIVYVFAFVCVCGGPVHVMVTYTSASAPAAPSPSPSPASAPAPALNKHQPAVAALPLCVYICRVLFFCLHFLSLLRLSFYFSFLLFA